MIEQRVESGARFLNRRIHPESFVANIAWPHLLVCLWRIHRKLWQK